MQKDLKQPIKVPFDRVFLDPNNPRIAPSERLGYDDPGAIFDDQVQSDLNQKIEQVYNVESLEQAIVAQGWVPLDAILVWEHHKEAGHYIVVEGNTRTRALRRIREKLPREERKLERMQTGQGRSAKQDIDAQQRHVEQLRQIVADTERLDVFPVEAGSPEQLEEKLPRLLGVRHVAHAQQWSPYATNLYMLALYQRLWEEKYGPDAELALEEPLVQKVGDMVSTGPTKTRRNVQAASAFSHFKRNYEDRLSEGDEFSDEDQYYFENILQNKFPMQQFEMSKEDLALSDEKEEVLFKWAFQHPRNGGEDNPNILRKAEDIRQWARIKRYDDKNGTHFASHLDVDDPDNSTPMSEVERQYINRRQRLSPIRAIQDLTHELRTIPGDILCYQSAHLLPLLEDARDLVARYITIATTSASEEARHPTPTNADQGD